MVGCCRAHYPVQRAHAQHVHGAPVHLDRLARDAERVERMLAILTLSERQEALGGLALLADAADALVRRGREDMEAQVRGEIA